jgi:hypothetical protein
VSGVEWCEVCDASERSRERGSLIHYSQRLRDDRLDYNRLETKAYESKREREERGGGGLWPFINKRTSPFLSFFRYRYRYR